MFNEYPVLFEFFLTDDESFASLHKVVSGLSLAKPERELLKWAKEFKSKHSRLPKVDELKLKLMKVRLPVEYDRSVYADELLAFVRNESIREWILKVAEGVDSGQANLSSVYREAQSLVDNLSGHDVGFRDFVSAAEKAVDAMVTPDASQRIPTMIKSLDKVLSGGFAKAEFACMIAPPGRGKSMFLINLAYGAVVSRYNVLFISLELSEEQILGRFARRIAKATRKDVRNDVVGTKDVLRRFGGIGGQLSVVYHKPHELTVDEIGVMVDKFNKMYGRCDMIVIDYFDRLRAVHRDETKSAGMLIDYMRDLGMSKNLVIASATQANRAALSATVVAEEHVSRAFSKIEASDVVLSINATDQEMADGTRRLLFLKDREGGATGAQVPVKVDFHKSLITDLSVAQQGGGLR